LADAGRGISDYELQLVMASGVSSAKLAAMSVAEKIALVKMVKGQEEDALRRQKLGISSRPRLHCAHCLGGPGPCACNLCPRSPLAMCVVQAHCAHCRGSSSGTCVCTLGCVRGPTTHCLYHCKHCAGGFGKCACQALCPRSPQSRCSVR